MCTISVDEMCIKSHLDYDSRKDKIIGLEDFGDGVKSNCLATSAIVIMARGIIENWKQPLAYYLVNESCSSEKVREKLEDAITKVVYRLHSIHISPLVNIFFLCPVRVSPCNQC